jgi:ATPase family AAA domain-containing protein 3A/B
LLCRARKLRSYLSVATLGREQLKKQEEMALRQEEMRRRTAEYEAELRTKTEIAKAKAEAEGRIAQERKNHDLILEKARLEAAERRDTVLKAIADGGKLVGEGVAAYLNDTEKLRNTALTVTGIAVGIYGARTSIGVLGRYVESRLGKPSLVRETSRLTLSQFARHPLASTQRALGMGIHEQDALKGIVLKESLDTQLRKIAVSTAHTKKNRAPFRHLLLHGTKPSPFLSEAHVVPRFVGVYGVAHRICFVFSPLQVLREPGKPCSPGASPSTPAWTTRS